jgi:LmbE family N-acetylglucosaminyl deacetylase
MGIATPDFLDFPDGGIAGLNVEARLSAFRAALESINPQVVLSLGKDGAYGHVDHIACHQMLHRALDLDLLDGVRVVESAFPRGRFDGIRDLLKRVAPHLLAPGHENTPLGIARSDADLCVDISALSSEKLEVLRAHQSQLPGGKTERFLLPHFIDSFLQEEWWTLTAGPEFPAGATLITDGL